MRNEEFEPSHGNRNMTGAGNLRKGHSSGTANHNGYMKSPLSGYCAPPLLTAVLGWAKK
jgi:hypothetical protein